MAKFNVVGLEEVEEAILRQDAIAEEAVPEMLKDGGAAHSFQTMKRARRKSHIKYTSIQNAIISTFCNALWRG